jgi:hypothetical protein
MGFLDIRTVATVTTSLDEWSDIETGLYALQAGESSDYARSLTTLAERIGKEYRSALAANLARDNARDTANGRSPRKTPATWHWQETLTLTFDWQSSVMSPTDDCQSIRDAWSYVRTF